MWMLLVLKVVVLLMHVFCCSCSNCVDLVLSPVPKVIKLFPCPTQLSTKFILLINVKISTIVGILTFITMINTTSKRHKARKNFFICQYLVFYYLGWAWNSFITSGFVVYCFCVHSSWQAIHRRRVGYCVLDGIFSSFVPLVNGLLCLLLYCRIYKHGGPAHAYFDGF